MSDKKGIFGKLFGKEEKACCGGEATKETCDCGGKCNTPFIEGAMTIKILGTGCKNCTTLEENTKIALAQLDMKANVEKVTEMSDIASYGVMSTPGLVINEKVVSYGKVLKPNDIANIIKK
ncbi:MAG: thioredoxin family protein, partial [Anaerotignaceae bacterium]